MPLADATVRPRVESWAALASPAWSAAQIDAIVAAMKGLSDEATPHIVGDAPLSADAEQKFLLARSCRTVEDWLLRAAADIRASFGLGGVRHGDDGIATPLRTATLDELDALDDVGPVRARNIARAAALHPNVRSITDLERVPELGDAVVESLERQAYLDRPAISLASATTLAFAWSPSIETYIAVLDSSDLEVVFGDANSLAMRPPGGGDSGSRFLALIELARQEAEKRRSPATGAFASDATKFAARQAKRTAVLDALAPVDGAVLVNAAYVGSAVDLIENATTSVKVMIFLATATPAGDDDVGSLDVIQALEARAAALPAGAVSVILDRDDQDDPFNSAEINQPLIDRLEAAGVMVKSDTPETLLHSKFIVADDTSAIVGSHNITSAAFNDTHEVSVRLDGAVAASFAARFDDLWAGMP